MSVIYSGKENINSGGTGQVNLSNYYTKSESDSNFINKKDSYKITSMPLKKAIICIVDDDGTTRTNDSYTGMTSWLNSQGVPMDFAVCYDTVGTSGKYSVSQLQELEAKGNEVLIHGTKRLQDFNTIDEVKTELETAIKFHEDNGFNNNFVYVYPNDVNEDTTLTAESVRETVGEYFDFGLSINVLDTVDYAQTKGMWNKIPLENKLNIGRMEIAGTKGFNQRKVFIDDCIANKGLLIFFTHSFQSQFLTGGGYTELQNTINYLLTQDVEFLTVGQALKKVNDSYIGNYNANINIPTLNEIEINDTIFPLAINKTAQIVVTKNFDGDISYSSSNNEIATVSNTGLITKIKDGEAIITVTCGEKTLTCKVVNLITKNSNVLSLLNIPYLHSRGITGKGIKVALMESFIKSSEELTIKGWYDTINEKYYDTQPSSISGAQTVNHSYHMASLIKGKQRGVAPDCEFYNVVVEGDIDYETALERCVDWCIENKIKVISDSLGFEGETNFLKYFNIAKKAYDNGIVIVQGIGNCYQGGYEIADENGFFLNGYGINVGACESNGNHNSSTCYGRAMMFNNYGFSGLQTWNPTNKYSASTNRTSAAAALTSGCVALLLQQDPSLTPRQIFHIFKDNAKQHSSYKQGEWNEYYGWGRITVPVLSNITYKSDDECKEEDNSIDIIDLYLGNHKNSNGEYEAKKDGLFFCYPMISPVEKDIYDIKVSILNDKGFFYAPSKYKNIIRCIKQGELKLLLQVPELGIFKEVKINIV
jgi:hypothetical protein